MKTKNTSQKTRISKKKYPWRKNQRKWTDTLFEKKLLANPSLMSNIELADALEEYRKWFTGTEKYDWQEDPTKEGKEDEMPLSPEVFGRIVCETIARLQIIGELTMGRFADHA